MNRRRIWRIGIGIVLLLGLLVSGCMGTTPGGESVLSTTVSIPTETPAVTACAITEPEWLLPPDDPAVDGDPHYGYYVVNEDRSIWAAAWWADDTIPLNYEEGIKVGWFRPAGVDLEISGRRTDGDAPPLKAEVPCCYPTRFQASGLFFTTHGCWEITAQAGTSTLTFTVWIESWESAALSENLVFAVREPRR